MWSDTINSKESSPVPLFQKVPPVWSNLEDIRVIIKTRNQRLPAQCLKILPSIISGVRSVTYIGSNLWMELLTLANGMLLQEEIPHSYHLALFREALNIVDSWLLREILLIKNKAATELTQGGSRITSNSLISCIKFQARLPHASLCHFRKLVIHLFSYLIPEQTIYLWKAALQLCLSVSESRRYIISDFIFLFRGLFCWLSHAV